MSQREAASRRRECRRPDHSQAPWISFRLPHAMGAPSWKPEPSSQEIFFKYQNEPYVDPGTQTIKEEDKEGQERPRRGCDANILSTDQLLKTTKVVTCKWEDAPEQRRGLSLTQLDCLSSAPPEGTWPGHPQPKGLPLPSSLIARRSRESLGLL